MSLRGMSWNCKVSKLRCDRHADRCADGLNTHIYTQTHTHTVTHNVHKPSLCQKKWYLGSSQLSSLPRVAVSDDTPQACDTFFGLHRSAILNPAKLLSTLSLHVPMKSPSVLNFTSTLCKIFKNIFVSVANFLFSFPVYYKSNFLFMFSFISYVNVTSSSLSHTSHLHPSKSMQPH